MRTSSRTACDVTSCAARGRRRPARAAARRRGRDAARASQCSGFGKPCSMRSRVWASGWVLANWFSTDGRVGIVHRHQDDDRIALRFHRPFDARRPSVSRPACRRRRGWRGRRPGAGCRRDRRTPARASADAAGSFSAPSASTTSRRTLGSGSRTASGDTSITASAPERLSISRAAALRVDGSVLARRCLRSSAERRRQACRAPARRLPSPAAASRSSAGSAASPSDARRRRRGSAPMRTRSGRFWRRRAALSVPDSASRQGGGATQVGEAGGAVLDQHRAVGGEQVERQLARVGSRSAAPPPAARSTRCMIVDLAGGVGACRPAGMKAPYSGSSCS